MTERAWVFVYGSLKRGFRHHDQMAGATFLGEEVLPSHHLVLYEGGYPALVEALAPPDPRSSEPAAEMTTSGGASTADPDSVFGELYAVDQEHLSRLDQFEDCPTLYERAAVILRSGVSAFAYRIPTERGLKYPRISGIWRED